MMTKPCGTRQMHTASQSCGQYNGPPTCSDRGNPARLGPERPDRSCWKWRRATRPIKTSFFLFFNVCCKWQDWETKSAFVWFPSWTCCHHPPISMGMQAKATETTWSATIKQQAGSGKDQLDSLSHSTKDSATPKHTFYPPPRCLLGLYGHILRHETWILHSPFIVCPAITPSLCWWKANRARSVWRGKGKNASLPCSAMLSFLFLLCQAREQPQLPFHYNQVFLLTVSVYTDRSFFHVRSHTHSVWQSGEATFFLPVNGLRNLWARWSRRAKEKVTAEVYKKGNRVERLSWQEGTLSPSRIALIAQMDAAPSLMAVVLNHSVGLNIRSWSIKQTIIWRFFLFFF